MSFENNNSITMIPLTAEIPQYRFVEVAAGGIQVVGVSGADSIGVSLEASDDGSLVSIPVVVYNGGKFQVEAGDVVAAGVRVMSDDSGRAITATGATARTLGWTDTDSSAAAAGEVLTILATKQGGQFVA